MGAGPGRGAHRVDAGGGGRLVGVRIGGEGAGRVAVEEECESAGVYLKE